MTLTNRYPTFLYEALKLQESKIPIDLEDNLIQSTIDAYQNGWALAVNNQVTFTGDIELPRDFVLITDSSFPPRTDGIADERKQKRVMGIDIVATIAGTGIGMELKYRELDAAFNPVRQQIIRRLGAAAGTTTVLDYFNDVMAGCGTGIFVPQNWQLVLTTGGTGTAGDTIQIEIFWSEFPAGFNFGIGI